MSQILDGNKVSAYHRAKIKEFLLNNNVVKPTVAVLSVGADPASQVYVKNKQKACEEVGINFKHLTFAENTTTEYIVKIIKLLNKDKSINGIMVQMPLPVQINTQEVIDTISPLKDVDCLTNENFGKISSKTNFAPCTARGIIEILNFYNTPIEGKTAVIVGRSKLAGHSTQLLLNKLGATTILCHSKTPNLESFTKQADILVSCVGKPSLITKNMVKDGSYVIDVGITRTNEGLKGDVDFANVKDKVAGITPVPGGVGPMTVAMLLENIVDLTVAQKRKEKIEEPNYRFC